LSEPTPQMPLSPWLEFGDVALKLRGGEQQFEGVADIRIKDRDLRHPAWPIAPIIQTVEGWHFGRFELWGVERGDGQLTLRTRSTATMAPIAPRGDWYHIHPPLRGKPAAPTADIDWHFRPIERTIAGRRFVGFSYHYHFRSDDARIHRLCDWATFELDGRAAGNLLIMRNCAGQLETPLDVDTAYTSSEQAGPLEGRSVGDVRTFMPRFGGLQCFDFQWRPEATMVLGYDRADAINGAVRKEAGCDFVEIADVHQFARTREVATTPHWVLVHEHEQPERLHEGRTTWMRTWRWFRRHYADTIDMPLTDPELLVQVEASPEIHQPQTGAQILDHLGDTVAPAAARCGFEAVYVGPFWEVARSRPQPVWGQASGEAESASMCTPLEYAFAEGWGGESAIVELARLGEQHGVKIAPWLAAHLANRMPTSPLFVDHPQWRVVNYDTTAFDGRYSDLASGDLHSGFGEYYLEQIRHFTEDLGIRAWFFDSYSNLALMPVNYASETLAPQFDKVWEIQRYCAERGVPWYIEADGPFGVPCLSLGAVEQVDDRAILRRFPGEQVYGLIDCNHRIGVDRPVQARETVPDDLFFRSLSVAGPLVPVVRFAAADRVDLRAVFPEPLTQWISGYKAVRQFMTLPKLLSKDRGVQWYAQLEDPTPTVLWTYRAAAVTFTEPVTVTDVLCDSHASGVTTYEARPHGIYRITRD